jgi:prepilin-type N-terminal cleavage/methylation domain-containing protein
MFAPRPSRGRPGLTVLELLVALVVISLLAALLVFGTGKTQEKSARAAMQNDLRNFSLAAELQMAAGGALPHDPTQLRGYAFSRGVSSTAFLQHPGFWSLTVQHAKSPVACTQRGGPLVSAPGVRCGGESDAEGNLLAGGDGSTPGASVFPGAELRTDETPPEGLAYHRFRISARQAVWPSQAPIPARAGESYVLSAWMRRASPSSNHRHYIGYTALDGDGQVIHPQFYSRQADSRLAQPLTPGDTVVYLSDSRGWLNSTPTYYLRSLGIWSYREANGRQWGDYTYTRRVVENAWDDGAIDEVRHTIRLRAPLPAFMGNPDHPNGTWPEGTALSNMKSGRSHYYCAASLAATQPTWIQYSAVVSPGSCEIPFPTVAIRPLLLLGYTPGQEPLDGAPVSIDIANFRVSRLP